MGMEGICYQGKRVRLWKILWEKSRFYQPQWFPDFANFRRDGYEFDALYDDCALGVYQSICGFRPYIHKPY